MALTRKDFEGFMENWDEKARRIITGRMEGRFVRERLLMFTPEEGELLRALLKRLIPGDEGIDLVGFLDWALDKPLGRGDRPEGMPEDHVLFKEGLRGIEESVMAGYNKSSFIELAPGEQDRFLTALQEGRLKGGVWERIPPSYFFIKLLTRALTGYCSHPLVWMRMGFPGPSFPEGYVWISCEEVSARRRHAPGWKTL